MKVYLADTFANTAMFCGQSAATEESEFEEYTGEEIYQYLNNSGPFAKNTFENAVRRMGCRDLLRIYNDRDYEIEEGPTYGVTDGNFRFYCEDNLPRNFTIKPEDA